MRLLINIPKEFEQHFQADRFEDSLHRLSADAHLLAGNYEQETAVMLIGAFAKAVPVPPHGRLIDADALMARFEKEEKAADEHGRDFSFSFKSGGENCTEWWPVQQMLMDAPTIIEAEEGE